MTPKRVNERAEIVIIGSGPGGGTLARALGEKGMDVLLVEQGDVLPSEPENWSATAAAEGRYRSPERWVDAKGIEFDPGVHDWVGGNSKMWGACLPRFRAEDFMEVEHRGGISPAWPITYGDLEPYYADAERRFGVHGQVGIDPTEPSRSSPFPHEAVPDEPVLALLRDRLRAQGLHPFPLPLGVDLGDGGRCIRCRTCDGFPCRVDAKADADVSMVRPAVASGNVRLQTRTNVTRLLIDSTGLRVVAAEAIRDGEPCRIEGGTFVVSCGAVRSAALLLASENEHHPNGLANSSGQVGRNYMAHNLTELIAVGTRAAAATFQKTLGLNDFYLTSPSDGRPLGNIQMIGKVHPEMSRRLPRSPWVLRRVMTARSLEFVIVSEDLPSSGSRVELAPDGRIRLTFTPNNLAAHRELVRRARGMLRRAGYPLVIARPQATSTSHQCGTIRFGTDPASAVLDPLCRAFDLDNLLVVDASFMPSSAALNPGLTIAAQALRVAALVDFSRGQ